MSTFARVVDGFALDIQIAATVTELASRFHPNWLAANPFIVVPDGTLHGATDNGDGTFTNHVRLNPIQDQPPATDPIADLRAQLQIVTDALAALSPAAAEVIAAANTPAQ